VNQLHQEKRHNAEKYESFLLKCNFSWIFLLFIDSVIFRFSFKEDYHNEQNETCLNYFTFRKHPKRE
jgi:hypothetical protein